MKQILSARFQQLWDRNKVPYSLSNPAFEALYSAYDDPKRGYHGVSHLVHLFGVFDEVSHHANFKDCLEAALWYHDYEMDLYRNDNELRSSARAEADLRMFGVSGVFRLNTCDDIMATMHTGDVVEPDEQLICDIDLSSFGETSWDRVCANTRGIRKEAPDTPLDRFIANRRRKLGEFLKRDRIYYTSYFRKHYEPRARENIMREIEQLPEILAA